jgi:hypothetical protein
VGVIDLATRTTQGITNTTSPQDVQVKHRFRPPRSFGPDRVVEVYSYSRSYGQVILQTWETQPNETYLFHFVIRKKILLVSTKQVVWASKFTLTKKWSLPLKGTNITCVCVCVRLTSFAFFSFLFSAIAGLEKNPDSLTFHLLHPLASPVLGTPSSGTNMLVSSRRIHIADPDLLERIHSQFKLYHPSLSFV